MEMTFSPCDGDLTLSPSDVGGAVESIPSKSYVHRMLICAFLCDTPTRIKCTSLSDDIETTANALKDLGADIQYDGSFFTVNPPAKYPETAVIDCHESGSTLRFLLPVTAALGINAEILRRGRLIERPLSPLYEKLIRAGAKISPQGSQPLKVSGRIKSGLYSLSGSVSSQYITGLLLALPLLKGDSEIIVTDRLESSSYVDITIETLHHFGVETVKKDNRFIVRGGNKFHSPEQITAEGDWSSAAFWLVLGATGSENGITVTGLNTDCSNQGDRKIIDILKRMGAEITINEKGVAVKKSPLHGCEIDCSDVPDLVPALCAAAANAKCKTLFYNASRLRLKESDRLESCNKMLSALSVKSEIKDDTLTVYGSAVKGGTVDTQNDHRIAMAAAVMAVSAQSAVTIKNACCCKKSYPSFFDELSRLTRQQEREA